MARLDRVDLQMSVLVLFWGSAFLGIKVVGETLDPYQLTWFRYLPFPFLYGAYLLARRRAAFRQVAPLDWAKMAALGFLGVVGYHVALNWGLQESVPGARDGVSGATGSILVATGPLWTLLLAAARGKERVTARALAGFLVAFAGVALVVLLGRGEAELTLAGKSAVILLAPMSWAVYSVFGKPLAERYGGLFFTGVSLSLGMLSLLPLGVGYGFAPLAALRPDQLAWLAFLAFACTALGYAIWNDSIKRRSASHVAAYIYAQPVVTAALAALFFHERLTAWFAAGTALVLAGVVQVNRARLAAASPATLPAVAAEEAAAAAGAPPARLAKP